MVFVTAASKFYWAVYGVRVLFIITAALLGTRTC